MTTEDRAYEAAARELVSPAASLDAFPEPLKAEVVVHAKRVVTAFLKAMGQEVR
jgi:hypothetical protein